MSEPTVRFNHPPVEAPITGGFGANYGGYLHRGVDFGCVTGTPVVAPAAGVVVAPLNDGSFGTAVCIRHDDGWFTMYAHLSRAMVALGDSVMPGQMLGLSGNTGLSSGPHLHWQLSDSWRFPTDISHSRDPMLYIQEEEEMTPADKALLDAVVAALTGGVPGVLEAWNANGNSMIVAYNDLVFPHLTDAEKHPKKEKTE